MSRINTNVPALNARIQLNRNTNDLNVRLRRLSTGLRINTGSDDPAGLIVSERLRSEIAGLGQAVDNSIRANNVITTTEGALNEVSALLLELQTLVVETANKGGLVGGEVNANQLQVDSLLESIDRIGQTTTFAGDRLIDGSKAYILSGVPTTAFSFVAPFSASIAKGSPRLVSVTVTQSAQTAQVSFVGTNTTGASTTSATTIELRGSKGSALLTFASGTSLAMIRDNINAVSTLTGVSAIVSAAGTPGVASSLQLNSMTLGRDALVSVEPVSGDFIEAGSGNRVTRDVGRDAGVLINGKPTETNGLRAELRSERLDIRVHLTKSFGQTLSSASFAVTGGGAAFQTTPLLNANGQLHAGFEGIATTQLGNPDDGLLYTLRSGNANDLFSTNFVTAQTIVGEAINQVASFRGRLGTLQKDSIDRSINSQKVALENVTAAESIIRDADIATEVSALTRAEILVQSTQTMLQIANSLPRNVLSLLG